MVSASTIAYVYNRFVREYQFVQYEAGRATLRVVPEDDVTVGQLEPIARTIRSVSDGLVSVDI